MIGKYKEAQGSIKGLQGKVQELEDKRQSGAAEGEPDPDFGATIAALQTQLREVTQAKDEAVQRAEAEAAAAAAAAKTAAAQQEGGLGLDKGGAGDDPAFGATIAALQTQLREVTQEKDEAVKRASVAGGGNEIGGGSATGNEAAAAVAAAREQLEAQEKAHQEALAEKQFQNEQLVQKVRQLLTTCRSLKEQMAAAEASPPAVAVAAGAEDLHAQLDAKQSENDKLLSRLRELAQRYRTLQQEQQDKAGGEGGGAAETPAVPADVAERLADAERQVASADEKAAELARRCEKAEAEHQRATGSLKEAVERLAVLESAADVAATSNAASASAQQEGLALQEKLRAESAALEERVAGLVKELQASREEKLETSAQLEAKAASFEKMVGLRSEGCIPFVGCAPSVRVRPSFCVGFVVST